MAKKNPAVLWSVEQSLEKGDKETARANIGINFNSAADASGNTLTFVSSIDENATTGDLTYNTKSVTVDQSYSGTSSNPASGKSIKEALDGLDATNNVTEGHYITAVNETDGIVSLTTAAMDTSPAQNSKKPVTSGGVWDAIDSLDVNNITGFGADKTLSALSETDGKISASFQSIAIGGSAITLGASGQAVVTDASMNLDTKDLQFIDSWATTGSDTNKFVSSVTADSTGKISVAKSTLASATSSAIGGIQLGYTAPGYNTDKKYAVQMDTTGDNAGKAYVQVPWQDTHYTSSNVICSSSTGTTDGAVTASDTAYLNHTDNGIVTSSHQILGSGVTVTADNSGNLTLSSSLSTFTTFNGTSNITTLNIDAVTKQLSQDGTPFGYYVPPVTSATAVGKVLTVTESSGSYSVEWAGSVIELDQALSKTSTKGLENRGIYDGIGMPNVYVRNITSGLNPPKLIHGCHTSNETTKNIISVAVNTSAYVGMTVKLLVSIVDSNKSYTYILDIKYQNDSPTWVKTSLLSIGPDHLPGWAIYRSLITATQTTVGIGRVMGSSETVPSALDTVFVSVYPLMVDGGATSITVDTETWSSVPMTPILPTVVPNGAYGGVGSDSYPVYVDQDGSVKEVGIILENSFNHDIYNIGTTHHLVINENWLNSAGSWWNSPELIQPLCAAMHKADTITMYRPMSYSASFQYTYTGCSNVYSHSGSGEVYNIYRYEFYSGTRVTRYHIASRYNTTTQEITWEQSASSTYPFSESFELLDTSGNYGNEHGTIYLL